jgi:hypothetical protein
MARKRDDKKEEVKEEHPAWENCYSYRPSKDDGPEISGEEIVTLCESPEGRPHLGKLYQVVQGDNHLTVARKALFGSSEPRVDPIERQAVIDLSIRMDCGPWNQTVNSGYKESLGPGHYAAEKGYTDKGILYLPQFPDNRARMQRGEAPKVGTGHSFPYIWVPMIDLDVFMSTGEVTTLGQDWPDEDGEGGYSKINPPPWVIDLGFEGDLNSGVVGCELPEGDFRTVLELEDDA